MADPPPVTWHLYLIRCADGSLYTGITTDVERRLRDHRSHRGAKYLRGRGPLELVYSRPVGQRGLALRLEHRIKALGREAKGRLLESPGAVEALLRQLET